MNHRQQPQSPVPPRLVLVSPVPAMRTGTGNYLGLLVNELVAAGCPHINVVTDFQHLPDTLAGMDGPQLSAGLFGAAGEKVSVVDHHCFGEEASDLCVYFAANNEYHHYVYDLLERPTRARRWLVIHEPSCLMYAIHYFRSRTGLGGQHALQRHLYAQYGPASEGLYDDIFSTGVVESLIHESFGFDWYSFGAETIIVHSQYAKQKLLYELHSPHPRPRLVVRHHPPEPSRNGSRQADGAGLIFGVFGFVNPSKKVNEVISGFAQFVRSIGIAEADALGLQLLIVGQLPSKKVYDPRGHAKQLGIERWTVFHDYVDKATFESLIDRCDTIFNLRFPSCGETTGLAAFLRPGLHIAVSDYHSFRELGADFHVEPGFEESGVRDVMLQRYRARLSAAPTNISVRKTRPAPADGPLVSTEILKGLQLVSQALSQAGPQAPPLRAA